MTTLVNQSSDARDVELKVREVCRTIEWFVGNPSERLKLLRLNLTGSEWAVFHNMPLFRELHEWKFLKAP